MGIRVLENVGGLGNQLFIWFAAHKIIKETDSTVLILTPKKSNRKNELDLLNHFCSHKIIILEANGYFTFMRYLEKIERRFFKKPYLSNLLRIRTMSDPSEYLEESDLEYLVIRGYFQYYALVQEIKEFVLPEINALLDLKLKIVIETKKLPKEYQAFHLRRGDFMENLKTIGVISDEFFVKLRSKTLKLVVCIEKSIELTKNFGKQILLDSSSTDPWEVISVLANAKELVISNSTLSWWAGVIGKERNPNMTVTAPKPWYLSDGLERIHLFNMDFDYKKATFIL